MGSRGKALLFFNLGARWGAGGQHHVLAALPLGKTWYPLYRRLRGPQGWSVEVQKISPSLGFDSQTVQPVAIRYTDWAILDNFNIHFCHSYDPGEYCLPVRKAV
jgi:hypothetical protein